MSTQKRGHGDISKLKVFLLLPITLRLSSVLIFYLGTFTFLLTAPKSSAQDFHLSQYDASPMYLNPSMTGLFSGYYRVHAHYRNQWSSVASPFTTTSVAFDMPYHNLRVTTRSGGKKIAIGGIILNNRAGTGNYNVLNFSLSAAYDLSFTQSKDHHISIGPQIGFIHKSVNIDKLLFHNQYTYTNSNGFDPGLPNGEMFDNASIILPDINAGIIYYYASDMSVINPFLGFSVFHLTEPNETFYSNENKLPRRYTGHGGIKINLTPVIQITPQILIMNQQNANEKTLSFNGSYYLKAQDAWVYAGIDYRSFQFREFSVNDAFISMAGLKYKRYEYRISYDINTSSLKSVSRGRGGFELSITYIAEKLKKNQYSCPRL